MTDVTDSIQDDKTISDDVRRRALALAKSFREEQDPKRFNEASRTLIRHQHLASRWYRQALRQAEVARRLAPEPASYLNTLGIALYRLEKYREAVDTLRQAEKLDATRGLSSLPADQAFLAMAHDRLGQRHEAKDYLNRLRETMKKPEWINNAEAQAFQREAEALLQAETGTPMK